LEEERQDERGREGGFFPGRGFNCQKVNSHEERKKKKKTKVKVENKREKQSTKKGRPKQNKKKTNKPDATGPPLERKTLKNNRGKGKPEVGGKDGTSRGPAAGRRKKPEKEVKREKKDVEGGESWGKNGPTGLGEMAEDVKEEKRKNGQPEEKKGKEGDAPGKNHRVG